MNTMNNLNIPPLLEAALRLRAENDLSKLFLPTDDNKLSRVAQKIMKTDWSITSVLRTLALEVDWQSGDPKFLVLSIADELEKIHE
jgi:hypothetical protein